MKKEKAAPHKEDSLQNNRGNNNSVRSQRARILKALEQAGSAGLSTIQLRDELNCMHPGGRVMELREEGHRIETVWTVTENSQGHKHRCARYVLLTHKAGVAA